MFEQNRTCEIQLLQNLASSKALQSRKVQDRKKTGGGPPVVMSPAENLWYDLFRDTVYCTGIVDHENFQEVGLGGNIFT